MAVSRNIAKTRKEQGLSQQQLADRLHVTRQTVSSWETGRTLPDVDMLASIAAALGADLNYLIYGERSRQSADKARLGRAVSIGAVVCAALFVLMLTAAAFCRVEASALMQSFRGQLAEEEAASLHLRISAFHRYEAFFSRAGGGFGFTALLAGLCVIRAGRLPIPRRRIALFTLAVFLLAALLILPFWLRSGFYPIDYYWEWLSALISCGAVLAVDAACGLAAALLRRKRQE